MHEAPDGNASPPRTLNVLLSHLFSLISVQDLFSAQIHRGISIMVPAKEIKHN